jgi:hypothetical protein
MMAKRFSFHIQQNLSVERLQAILEVGAEGAADMTQLAAKCELAASVLERIVLPFVRQSGLLCASGLSLSRLGIQFSQLTHHSPALLPEAMHCLLYTTHVFDPAKRFSWAYARVVDALWESDAYVLDGQATARLVGMVVEEASQAFGVPIEKIAFSRDSIRGVLNWLQALEPPVIESTGKSNCFRRRHYCPPLAFLWAVDFLYRAHCTAHGVRMFLTPERVDQLCRSCALDPSGLENVLMMTKRTSDYDRGGVFDYGTEGGFGRWVLLTRPRPVPTLPSGGEP